MLGTVLKTYTCYLILFSGQISAVDIIIIILVLHIWGSGYKDQVTCLRNPANEGRIWVHFSQAGDPALKDIANLWKTHLWGKWEPLTVEDTLACGREVEFFSSFLLFFCFLFFY